MAINLYDARVGHHVYYQQPHMSHPEYGRITEIVGWPEVSREKPIVKVDFAFHGGVKPCYPWDLHWPPWFCAIDNANPPRQKFDDAYEYWKRHAPENQR